MPVLMASVAPAIAVNSLLTNAGIANAQVAAVGDTVQLSFTNPSQALISSALGKLSEQGSRSLSSICSKISTPSKFKYKPRLLLNG